jgi:Ca-activated chloride channel family protein
VFLVDVSGSMQGEDRLELARKALNVLIDQLRPQDSVAMAVYAGAAGSVLEPTSGREKLKMRCALQALNAGGSTAGGAGLALAYKLAEAKLRKDAVNRVVLLTDGDFNVGVVDGGKLEDFVAEKRQTGVYLSIYGFGGGNYNDALMQTLAQAGNGTAAYVDTLAEGRKAFRDDFGRSLFPIADDVKIQVEFNPSQVSEYRLIGYESRLLNREDFNNDKIDAGEVGSGASVTALYEITPVGGPSSVDPLRYQAEPATSGASKEIAFLRVRWKAPGGTKSQLMERPIGPADRRSLDRAPDATRLALAVAAYGQKLRSDPWLGEAMDWAAVERLAGGVAEDGEGLRREFASLVGRAAKTPSVAGGR